MHRLEDSDDELMGMSAPVDVRDVGGSNKWKRGAAAATGALALLGCLALVAHYTVFAQEASGHVTARALLESPELANVVTDQLVTVAGRGDADRTSLHDHVQSGFQEMSQIISAKYPTTARQLDETQLSPAQQAAVMQSYRSMADPRVLRIGSDILQAASESQDATALKARVLAAMQPRAEEIRQLRDTVLPMAPGQARSTMDLANMDGLDIVRTFDQWHVEVSVSTGKTSRRMQSGLSSLPVAGMAQQTNVFMNLMAAMKPDFVVPDLSGLQEGLVSDLFSCISTTMSSAAMVDAVTCVSTFFSEAVNYFRSSVLGGSPGSGI